MKQTSRAPWFVAALAGLALVLCGYASPAFADGPCGQDYATDSACTINGTGLTETGTIVASDDTDYYVFHASAETKLSVSINDTEDPGCSTSDEIECGDVSVELYDAKADDEGGTGSSSPDSGLAIPQNWTTIIPTAGTYYLEVSGSPGSDVNDNPTSVPYTLQVTGSPGLVWPYTPPPPSCEVPKVSDASLATAEHHILQGHCTVGRVRHSYSATIRKGDVIAISPAAGRTLANDASINIAVSLGRKPKPKRKGKS
jgi:Bacterial pre-peptidase C-terminal domain